MMAMNEREALESAIKLLRSVAQPVGPQHAFWDTIFECEAALKAGNQDTLDLSKRAAESVHEMLRVIGTPNRDALFRVEFFYRAKDDKVIEVRDFKIVRQLEF